ncbi:hypothetical protein B1T44_28785, partial [Mycobacterium persicum]
MGAPAPAIPAVAEQPAAVPAGGPGSRSPVGAVADQWTPGNCLDRLVNDIEHILLQGVQRVGAGRSGNSVGTQQQPAEAAEAGLARGRAGASAAAVTAVPDQHAVAAGAAVATGSGRAGAAIAAVTTIADQAGLAAAPAGPT